MKTKIKKLMLTIVLVLSAVVLSPAQTNYTSTKRVLEGDNPQISIIELAVNTRPYENEDIKFTRILAKNGMKFAITFPESYQNLSIVRNNRRIEVQGRKIVVNEPGNLSFKFTYTENGTSYTCDILGDVNYYGELKYQGQALTSRSIIISNVNDLSKRISADPKMAGVWWRVKVGSSYVDICEGTQARTLQELLDFAKAKGVNGKAEFEVEFSDGTSNRFYKDGVLMGGAYSVQYFSIEDARTYNLSLSQVGQGTVSVSKNQLKSGESATLTAQAAQGWRFDHWEESAQNLGTTNPLTVTMGTQDRSIKAVFKEKARVTLQIVDTNGRELAQSQSQEVTSGGSVTFQVPNLANVNFKGWKRNGQIVETGNTYTLSNVTQNETIQAVFEVPVQSISLSFTELNLKVGESKPLPNVTVIPSNATDQTITWVSNNPGIAKIENGKVVGVSAEVVNLVASSSNQKKATLKVVVQPVKHTVTVQLVAEGTSQSLGTKSYEVEQGKTVTVKATELGAEAKYEFVKWDRNGVLSSEQSISFVVNSSETLKAFFKEKVVQAVKHTVTVQLVAEGTSQSLGTKSYEVEQGKTVTLKATELGAEAKYEFVKWDRNGTVSSEQSISFVVNSSETLKAFFKEKVVQPQESDFPPYTANLQTFKVNQTVDASKVVWENFPQGLDKTAIKYSLRDFNGVDISNNKQIFEANGQNLTFKKIGSYFLIATLRDNQNNEIRIDLTIQVNE